MIPRTVRLLAAWAATMVLAAGAGIVIVQPAGADTLTWGSSVHLDPQFVDVAGVRTSYATLGPARDPALLLLNGTGSPMSQWDPALLEVLSRTRRVIVYDYPGLGGSSALTGRLTFDRLARHAEALLGALGYRSADVLGWSMGGFVAQRLAVRSPARVDALVLAATNPGGPAAVLGPPWVQQEDSDAASTARDYVRTNYPATARSRGRAFIRRVNSAIDAGRFPPDRVPARTYEAMVSAEDGWLMSGANLDQLAHLSLPTLVIAGAEDVVTPPPNSRLLATTIPGAHLELVPHAGHSFLFQEPYRVGRTVGEFLDDARSRRVRQSVSTMCGTDSTPSLGSARSEKSCLAMLAATSDLPVT